MSTTLPYSGFSVPSMIPGWSRNWRRTSKMTAPAARETALIGQAGEQEHDRRTEDADRRGCAGWRRRGRRRTAPGRSTSGTTTLPAAIAAFVAETTVSRNAPNSAVAASTAVAIAMPLVIAFVVLPTASRLVRTWAPSSLTSPDISAMPCALSDDRAEGVHRDDDADRGEQPAAGERDREQRQQDRAAAEQVGAEHRGADEQRGVDRRLEADRDAGEDDGGRTGERALRDVVDRLAVGLGEVAGQLLDGGGEHDADEHRADGQDARVERVDVDQAEVVADDAVDLGDAVRQVERTP